MAYFCEIVYRGLGNPTLGSSGMSSRSSSSQGSHGRQSQPSASQSSFKAKKGKPKHPPILAHWAVAVEVDAGSEILGYEAGRYYYGLMPGEGGSNSRLCQLDTEEWDSLGQSAQRLSGLTDHGPHELLVIGSSIIEETPPYDLTSNNCQDFAVKFFVAIQSSLDSLEENLEALQKGHLGGLLRLITFTKKEEDGYLTYDIYDRNGKLFRSLTQGGKTGWHHRRPRRVAYAPGGPNVEGGPFASDANRNEMKDIEGDMNVNIQGDLPQYQGVPAFQYQDALQPPNTDPYGQPLNHFGGAPDYAPQG